MATRILNKKSGRLTAFVQTELTHSKEPTLLFTPYNCALIWGLMRIKDVYFGGLYSNGRGIREYP